MFHGGEDVGAVVADIGSSYARLGFAGDDSPRAYLPSVSCSVVVSRPMLIITSCVCI
jgi:hypothetical protein